MNYFYNDPSENRVEFSKHQVACKYASIGGVSHITDTQPVVNFYSQKELFLALKNSCFGQL